MFNAIKTFAAPIVEPYIILLGNKLLGILYGMRIWLQYMGTIFRIRETEPLIV
jgi:hypothetical protein